MLQWAVNKTTFASPTKSKKKGVNIFNIQFNLQPKNQREKYVLASLHIACVRTSHLSDSKFYCKRASLFNCAYFGSSGTDCKMSPISSAFVPDIRSPVNSICLAFSAPNRYTHMAVVGQPQTRDGG